MINSHYHIDQTIVAYTNNFSYEKAKITHVWDTNPISYGISYLWIVPSIFHKEHLQRETDVTEANITEALSRYKKVHAERLAIYEEKALSVPEAVKLGTLVLMHMDFQRHREELKAECGDGEEQHQAFLQKLENWMQKHRMKGQGTLV